MKKKSFLKDFIKIGINDFGKFLWNNDIDNDFDICLVVLFVGIFLLIYFENWFLEFIVGF